MWPYPVITDAQNSVNTCDILTELTKSREWGTNNKRERDREREGGGGGGGEEEGEKENKNKMGRGEEKEEGGGEEVKKKIVPKAAAPFLVSFEAKYSLILNNKGPHRDLKPIMTFHHPNSSIVLESLLCHRL